MSRGGCFRRAPSPGLPLLFGLIVLLLATAAAGGDGWLETHRKMKRGCRMGGMGPEVQACYAAGEAAMARNATPEALILESCRELGAGKLRLLCVEEMMDHIGPTGFDPLWQGCHRRNGSVRAIRACLLNALFPDTRP